MCESWFVIIKHSHTPSSLSKLLRERFQCATYVEKLYPKLISDCLDATHDKRKTFYRNENRCVLCDNQCFPFPSCRIAWTGYDIHLQLPFGVSWWFCMFCSPQTPSCLHHDAFLNRMICVWPQKIRMSCATNLNGYQTLSSPGKVFMQALSGVSFRLSRTSVPLDQFELMQTFFSTFADHTSTNDTDYCLRATFFRRFRTNIARRYQLATPIASRVDRKFV